MKGCAIASLTSSLPFADRVIAAITSRLVRRTSNTVNAQSLTKFLSVCSFQKDSKTRSTLQWRNRWSAIALLGFISGGVLSCSPRLKTETISTQIYEELSQQEDVEIEKVICPAQVKPEVGQLLLSPADETPSAPCDAQPEEWDIALCIDRVQRALDLPVQRIASRWAGLRSFAGDGLPVVGLSTRAANFFWMAGQGGYGIQTAPAIAAYAAACLAGNAGTENLLRFGFDPGDVSPARFADAESGNRQIWLTEGCPTSNISKG